MRVYEPIDGNFADVQTGIVLFNQFGATVSQDAGRDAQFMADAFNLPVIAVNRPGTAGFRPNRKLAGHLSTPSGYLAEMTPIGKAIDRQVENHGIAKVIATGRSAGGLGALALSRTETVSNMKAVFAAEPVGCEQLSLKDGAKRYSDYLKYQKELLDAATDDELVKPLPPGLSLFPAVGRLLSIPPAMIFDRFHNQKLFANDAAQRYAEYIARNLTPIDTTIEFAEHSMVATPSVFIELESIAGLRHAGAPFIVKRAPRTVHSSFDNRTYMNEAIEPTIARTLARPIIS